ncbi:programmed cell death 1 ligand 1-like isoform X1 [Betta splendens]|uniref:Programmed cell death 1 ligand 1-like isoform X1 n=1 Tax=Betta splendens TaxID=158456 RepID=A0A6P7PKV4_BETSP|nr:programmed cell death 1 ligand 1-like isoform X1 [Betta splendens]
MIVSFLLIVPVTLCAPEKHHKKAQTYEVEENHNVTVEWCFSSRVDVSVASLKIHCLLTPELKVFYHLDQSVKEPQHQQFSGRVHCDVDALGAGRVRLHLSRARTEDSGQYLCRMSTGFGRKVNEFWLNVTAAADRLKPVLPPPQPSGRHRIFLCLCLVLPVAAVVVLVSRLCCSSDSP